MLLSILTPTLIERRVCFQLLQDKLQRQIREGAFSDHIEHLCFEDNRERSIGYKRNVLMDQAKGKFIVFVDDDDDVSDNYVSLICEVISNNPEIDCIGFRGTITFKGRHPHEFVQSLQYHRFSRKNGVYYRSLMHINPIRRDIAVQYRFEDISYSEDIDWIMGMIRDKTLSRECFIDQTLYFYDSRRQWWYQQLIDVTEDIRQMMGIQMVNRVRLRRWLRGLF